MSCELCGRMEELTDHHLIPRTRHKNKKNKRDFSRGEVKERKAYVCRPCHNNIHALLSEKELERDYNTIESLKAHPGIAKFTEWIKNKPIGFHVPNKRAK